MNDLQELQQTVERARALADQARPGSLDRRAAGCVVVAFATTRSAGHARRVLDTLADPELRAACRALTDHLTLDAEHQAATARAHDSGAQAQADLANAREHAAAAAAVAEQLRELQHDIPTITRDLCERITTRHGRDTH